MLVCSKVHYEEINSQKTLIVGLDIPIYPYFEMKTKGHRSGPLPADLYADLVTFHKSGHLSPTLSPTLDMGIRFRVIADIGEKVRLEPGTNTLICKNTGHPMVAKERFEAAVMAVHTRDGLDGPGHRGILSTINQVSPTIPSNFIVMQWSCQNF